MRKLMTLTALSVMASVMALTVPVLAQSQVSPQVSPQVQQDPAGAESSDTQPVPQLTKVEIVEFGELSPRTQNQVDAVIATMKQEDMQKLHQSIDAIPEASAALKAKGVSSSQVVVASLDEKGTLTLITKTT